MRNLVQWFIWGAILPFSLFGWDAPLSDTPILYGGRCRPAGVAAQQWLFELSHRTSTAEFALAEKTPLQFLWGLHARGTEPYRNVPLFWIANASTKRELHLPTRRSHFSYAELEEAFRQEPQSDEAQALLARWRRFNHKDAGGLLCMLPSRTRRGEWLPLNTLAKPGNPTLYHQEGVDQVRAAYDQILNQLRKGEIPSSAAAMLAHHLNRAYTQLAGSPWTANRSYPALWQLSLESWYHRYPWPLVIAIGYLIALAALLLPPSSLTTSLAIISLSVALLTHTALLTGRVAVLMRPPVSNMFETVLYVPWIATLSSLLFGGLLRSRWVIATGATSSAALLVMLHIARLDSSMENVQAVLDSQYWLTIHVLMVVGSYGLLIMSGIAGHLYLFSSLRPRVKRLETLSQAIQNSMYAGVGLLIVGTILGGVWAAQSWGRFWDWDPKESWAFITSCVYLVIIHLHRFHHIGAFGLAVGSIAGLLSVAFTWYGVNFILGSGLHSYGFGNGSAWPFWLFVVAECVFISLFVARQQLFLAKKKSHF